MSVKKKISKTQKYCLFEKKKQKNKKISFSSFVKARLFRTGFGAIESQKVLVCLFKLFLLKYKKKNVVSFCVFVLVPSNSDDEIELKGLENMFGFHELQFFKTNCYGSIV